VNPLGAALAAGVDAAFPRLVETTQHRVYSLALSLCGNAEDAKDVSQDTFVRAYRALRTYPQARLRSLSIHPWLAKIALNVWRNRIRGRRDTAALDVDIAGDERDRPDVRVQAHAAGAEMRALLGTLPQRYRMAVVLRYAHELPYAQAAGVLGIPEGTVKAQVHRGMKMLRERYERKRKVNR
jgi:RNA polymerase sigma factor (sigma-70 family)